MRPTKRTQAVKKPRKIATKRAYDTKSPIGRLHKLRDRINNVYDHRLDDTGDLKSDKTWVVEEITNLITGGWLSATKMKVANEMWRTYGG